MYKKTKADDEMIEYLNNVTPENKEGLRLFAIRELVKDLSSEYSDELSDDEVQALADQLVREESCQNVY